MKAPRHEFEALCPAPPGAGEPARDRLLQAALRLFAEHGYAKTSIRGIALAAGANVASISYYFGNKAGLYRAVFFGAPVPLDAPAGARPAARSPVFSLDGLFRHILEPLRSGQDARHWIKLHRREMLEPTGLWREKVDRGMQPMHAALVSFLCGELAIDRPDDEVKALAIQVIAPAVHLLVNCEVVDVLAPQLLAGTQAIDAWQARLLRGARALIDAERRRRASAAHSPRPRRAATQRSRSLAASAPKTSSRSKA
ncbi:MAG: CerR family C-terminal domain-containing protein [Caldimonas sp.]